MTRLRWALAFTTVGALGFLALELRYFLNTRAMFLPDKVAPAPLPGAREVAFRTRDGLTLRGARVSSRNGVTVVMGHGLGQNRDRFRFEAELFARHGYGALMFDWRGHGLSDGIGSTWSDLEQEDFRAAVGAVSDRVAALGFSIGASTVAEEAATDRRVEAVILEAVWPSFAEELADKTRFHGFLTRWPGALAAWSAGVHADRIRPIDCVARIAPRPLLFITGAADQDTPVRVVQRVFAAAGEPKALWVVPDAGHGAYAKAAPAAYERALVDFLDRAFSPPRRGPGASGPPPPASTAP